MITRVQSVAKQYGIPLSEAQEFWSERAAIREYEAGLSRLDAESAVEDLELWAKLWAGAKGGEP